MDTVTDEKLLVERDLLSASLAELKSENSKVGVKINHLQNELSDLAFHNYRTYVDVGRTAEHCKDMFTEMNNIMHRLRSEFPQLGDTIANFKDVSKTISTEYSLVDSVDSANCLIWEVLKLPKLMEKCIRAGRYEQAYALTNFAITWRQSKLAENPIFEQAIDSLIEARHSLLDELFSKFVGPIDLARSIQVVNNIRKIPYISNTQLRVSILQYRDIYLDKNVTSIMSEPDFLLRVIDVYRECMYDTIVLYLAVFPDADIKRKFVSMGDDPRWERWTGSSQTFLLQSWAQHHIERLLSLIRAADQKTCLDLEAMLSKMMSFAFSFGRMGLDFRGLILHEFSQMVVQIFRKKIDAATKSMVQLQKLDLIDGDIFENTRQDLEDRSRLVGGTLSAPLELCIWDDLCVFGNSIIAALNEVRHSVSLILARQMYAIIHASLQQVFRWLDAFVSKSDQQLATARKAAQLLLRHFVPFMRRCFFHYFPYEQFSRHFRTTHCPSQQYRLTFSLLNVELFAFCKNDGFFVELLKDIEAEDEIEQQQQDGVCEKSDGLCSNELENSEKDGMVEQTDA